MQNPEREECDRAQKFVDVGEAGIGSPLTADQIKRWAALIAEGEDGFPQDLSVGDHERLAAQLRLLLRERLLALVARAIARDIYRRERHDMEVDRD